MACANGPTRRHHRDRYYNDRKYLTAQCSAPAHPTVHNPQRKNSGKQSQGKKWQPGAGLQMRSGHALGACKNLARLARKNGE